MSYPHVQRRLRVALRAVGASIEIMDMRHRNPETCRLRWQVWWLMRQPVRGVRLSYPEIADACGASHSTVIVGVKRHEAMRAEAERGAA